MNYILLYILLVVFAVALKNITKFKIGRNINLSILLMILVFMIGCSNFVFFTRRVFIGLFLVACLYIAYCFIKKHLNLKELIDYIVSPSFFLFTILFIVFAVILYNAELTNTDDTYFWGQLVKNSLTFGTMFPKADYLNVSFGSYPPLYVGYLTMISSLLGGFKESYLLFGNAIFCVSFVISIYDDAISKKTPIVYTLISSIVFVLVLFTINWSTNLQHDTYLFNCIYADWPLAVVFGYAFYRSMFQLQGKPDIIYYALALITMTLTKQVGFVLAAICLATSLLRLFYLSNFKKKKEVTIIVLTILIILIFIPSIKTNIYIQLCKVVGQHIAIYAQEIDPWIIVNVFIDSVLKCNIVMHPIGLTYTILVVLFTGIIAAIGFYEKNTSIKVGAAMYLLGAIGYAIVMCVFYTYYMGTGESLDAVQFSRYMQVYTFPGIMIIIFLILRSINTKSVIIALAFCCLFVEPKSFMALKKDNLISIYHDPIEELKSYVEDEYKYEKVYVVNTNDAIAISKIRAAFGIKGQNVAFGAYDEDMTLEDFKSVISGYDYLLIGGFNEKFYDKYWSKISETQLVEFTLYRIVPNGDGNVEFYFAHSFIEEANLKKAEE